MNLTKRILVKEMLVNQEMAVLIFLKSGPFGFLPEILHTIARQHDGNVSTNDSSTMLTAALNCHWLKGAVVILWR